MYDTYRTLQRGSWPSGRWLEFFSVFFQRRQSSSTFSVPQKLPSRYNLKDRLSILRFAFYGNSGCTKWFHLGRARTFSEYQDETLWTLGCRVFAGLLPQKTPTSKCPWHDLVNSNKKRLRDVALYLPQCFFHFCAPNVSASVLGVHKCSSHMPPFLTRIGLILGFLRSEYVLYDVNRVWDLYTSTKIDLGATTASYRPFAVVQTQLGCR